MNAPRLFLISDLALASAEDMVERARVVATRARERVMFGVRDHDAPAHVRLALACALIEAVRPLDARVVVHDRIDIALAADADGVHLAERSIETVDARGLLGDRYVGRSCHDAASIARATDVDAITLSPLYASPGKGAALGVERFVELAAGARVPVVALGGIDASNVGEVLAIARGIALIRGWLVDDPVRLTEKITAR